MTRPPRPRQRSVSHSSDAIDKHILALHSAMADKLLANPAYINSVRATLERRYQAGQLRHSAYIHWHCVLDCVNEPSLFRQALLCDGERMRKLRRRTILVGILSEQERDAVLQNLII